jgi:putative SOS response-associated peptidase YedK
MSGSGIGTAAILTTAPGSDIKPYHDRQICVLPPASLFTKLRRAGSVEFRNLNEFFRNGANPGAHERVAEGTRSGHAGERDR